MERPELLDDYFRYVPIRETDMDWGLYVTGGGSVSMMPGYTDYPTRSHPQVYEFDWESGRKLAEYQALYIPWGVGEFESTATGRVEIDGGCLFFAFPGEWHRYRPSQETGWDEYWISFAGDHMDRLVQRGFVAVHGKK